MKKILFSLFLLGCSASFAHAHMFWVNAFESGAHNPPHAMIAMGWGHLLPIDDILTDPHSARIGVEKLELFDPELKKTDLIKIKSKITEAEVTNENFDIFPADLAAQKIALKKDSLQGVYQVGAISEATCYTHYIDSKGRKRMKHKPKDELDNIKEVKASLRNQSFAKAYITLGNWTEPKPLGHKLEIIPLTDLSNVHVGDMVEVKVLFYGETQSTTHKNMIYITAGSNTFGLDEGFNLQSFLVKGKAQFRVQSKGQWIINTMKGEDVTKDGKLKDFYGKVDTVYHTASLTFNVK